MAAENAADGERRADHDPRGQNKHLRAPESTTRATPSPVTAAAAERSSARPPRRHANILLLLLYEFFFSSRYRYRGMYTADPFGHAQYRKCTAS